MARANTHGSRCVSQVNFEAAMETSQRVVQETEQADREEMTHVSSPPRDATQNRRRFVQLLSFRSLAD